MPLPMGSLVECHLATSYAYNGGSACAGVAWAACRTPEGEECAIVAKITTELITKRRKHSKEKPPTQTSE